MKIVMAANWWYRRGGLGAVMLAEAEGLTIRGHDVVPFAAAHPDNLPSDYDEFFPPFRETAALARGASLRARVQLASELVHNRAAAHAFTWLVEAVRPDVVHLHGPARQLSPSILSVARACGIPIVITAHDYGLVCPQGLLLKSMRHPCRPPNCTSGAVWQAVRNRCVKGSRAASAVASLEFGMHRVVRAYKSDAIVAPSRFVGLQLVEAGFAPNRIRHIPNGIDPERVVVPPPRTGGHVLFAGRLVPEKGVDVLLAAAALDTSIAWVVAGDGPMRQSLEEAAPRNVRFVGHVDQETLRPLLDDAVVVVAPSKWYENAPLAVLEAMRAARPVVVSDLGGQPELVELGGGLVVPPFSSQDLLNGVRTYWTKRDWARRTGALGREVLLERYTLERHLDALEHLYAELTA